MNEDKNRQIVTKVSEENWRKAQKAECEVWKIKSTKDNPVLKFTLRNLFKNNFPAVKDLPEISSGDDWNFWWMDKFDNYSFLPKQLDKVIEIGCGPFSNMRLIMEKVKCSNVYLNDPLIKEYIIHTAGFVSNAVKRGEVLIDNSPAENLPYKDNYFDLVVMINVLDHVMDAEKVMNSCHRITKKGGFFILGQDLKDEQDVQKKHSNLDDILHPLKFPHSFLNNMLKNTFTTIYLNLLSREAGRNPEYHYGTYIYAGQKL